MASTYLRFFLYTFVFGILFIALPLVYVFAQSACHQIVSPAASPDSNYSVPYNLLSSAKELLLSGTCTSNSIQVTAGLSGVSSIVAKQGYELKNGAWLPITYTGTTYSADANWLQGTGSATLSRTSTELQSDNYVIAYACILSGGQWKCGCADSSCTTSKWQVQSFKSASASAPTVSLTANPASISSGGGSSLTLSPSMITAASPPFTTVASNTIDSALNMVDGCTDVTGACSTGTDQSDTLTIDFDLGASYALTQARLFGDTGGSWQSSTWTLRYKQTAGGSWSTAFSGSNAFGNQWFTNALSVTARFVQLEVKGTAGSGKVQATEFDLSGTSGGSSTLSWSSTNATSCTASGAWSGTKSTSGSQSVSPSSTSTYTLTCTGAGGSASDSATVTVGGGSSALPTVSLTASPTSITAGGSSTLSWSSTNATSCTASGGWSGTKSTNGSQSVSPTSNTTYTLTCTGAGGSASNSATVTVTQPVSDLIGHYKFDGNANDSSGNNAHGTVNGALFTGSIPGTSGRIGQAAFFDKIDDAIVIPHHQRQLLTSGFTISAWVRPNTTGENPYGRIVDKSTATSGGLDGYALYMSNGSKVSMTVDSTTAVISTDGSVPFGQWTHVVATVSNTGATTIYTNGTVNVTGTTGPLSGIVTINPLTIGNRSNATDRTFDGLIDDVRIYNRVLSQSEVQALCDLGNCQVPSPTVSLTASPSSITTGGSSTLSWSVANATSCTASGAWSGTKSTSGSQSVSPSSTSTYTLTCTGAGGSTSKSATVTVSQVSNTSCLPPLGGGTTYYIAPNGSDSNPGTNGSPFKTFPKAVSVLGPGDTLILKDGTYLYHQPSDSLQFVVNLTNVQGTSAQPITIKAQNDKKAIIDGQGRTNSYGFWLQNTKYINIIGIDVRGHGVGIRGREGVRDILLSHMDIHNNWHIVYCVVAPAGFGIITDYDTLNFTLQNSLVHNNGRLPAEVYCTQAQSDAINGWDQNVYSLGRNTKIQNNIFYDNWGGYHIKIMGYSGASVAGPHVIITNNLFINPSGRGSNHNPPTNDLRAGFLAWNNNAAHNTPVPFLQNNIFYNVEGSKDTVAWFSGTGSSLWPENYFYNNLTTAKEFAFPRSWPDPTLTVSDILAKWDLRDNIWNTDPLLTSDLRGITSSSPGIDKGRSQYAPGFDYYCNPRNDGQVDIGPFEL
jgi:hypothetical protein